MERLLAWYRISSSVGAVVALVVANTIPLFGVLFLGWNVWLILIVYWLENGIVGVFNVLKMLRAEGPMAAGEAGGMRMNGKPVDGSSKAAIIPFFVMHYGIFWVVHGVFVLALPVFSDMGPMASETMTSSFNPGAVVLAVIALTVSHGVSFYWNFLRGGEYRRVSAAGQMFAPYARLVVLHLTVIGGGIAIASTGAPAVAVVILVGLKIVLDIGLHLAEHRRAGRPPGMVPAA